MDLSYYDTITTVRELRGDRADLVASLPLPHRVVASVAVPAGRLVVRFITDSALLADMFAANWAPADGDSEPDGTLYALTRPAFSYGLADKWDRSRWWSRDRKSMIVFGCGRYRLAKVCVRGICSAISGGDTLFLHGCALSLRTPEASRGVVITGGSGAGKTTLVARLLQHAGFSVTVINDDWGPISASSGTSVSTGERRLHIKSVSVRALRPDFFASTPPGSYAYDRSEPDPTARLLAVPQDVYGASWRTEPAAIEHVAVIVREPPGWVAPTQAEDGLGFLKAGGRPDDGRRREMYLNGSLILAATRDERREDELYRRLLGRTRVSFINNCGTPEDLADRFVAAVFG
jgi:hypothetical protein